MSLNSAGERSFKSSDTLESYVSLTLYWWWSSIHKFTWLKWCKKRLVTLFFHQAKLLKTVEHSHCRSRNHMSRIASNVFVFLRLKGLCTLQRDQEKRRWLDFEIFFDDVPDDFLLSNMCFWYQTFFEEYTEWILPKNTLFWPNFLKIGPEKCILRQFTQIIIQHRSDSKKLSSYYKLSWHTSP